MHTTVNTESISSSMKIYTTTSGTHPIMYWTPNSTLSANSNDTTSALIYSYLYRIFVCRCNRIRRVLPPT